MIREDLAHAAEMPSIPMEEKASCCFIGCENYNPRATGYCSNDCYSEDMNSQHMRMEAGQW